MKKTLLMLMLVEINDFQASQENFNQVRLNNPNHSNIIAQRAVRSVAAAAYLPDFHLPPAAVDYQAVHNHDMDSLVRVTVAVFQTNGSYRLVGRRFVAVPDQLSN